MLSRDGGTLSSFNALRFRFGEHDRLFLDAFSFFAFEHRVSSFLSRLKEHVFFLLHRFKAMLWRPASRPDFHT
jgi:hypothetical protein